LADGPRKEAILSLARGTGVPAEDVFVQDASRQSTLLNAHVSGIGGTVRIVLDDITIERTPETVVSMIMAHEIGHYVLAHGEELLVFNTIVMGLGFLVIGWASSRLLNRCGSRWEIRDLGDVGALPIFWGLFLLWGYLTLPVTNGLSRRVEREADLFALNAAREPLAWAEFAIGNAEVQQLDPSSLVAWIYDDHPSAQQRILTAMRWRAEHLPAE
jgi:STE24 endopeptidase